MRIILLLWFICSGSLGLSQISCDSILSDAQHAIDSSDFRDAILKYIAAKRICDVNKHNSIDNKIIDVFEKIDTLKRQAEKDRRAAIIARDEEQKTNERLLKTLGERDTAFAQLEAQSVDIKSKRETIQKQYDDLINKQEENNKQSSTIKLLNEQNRINDQINSVDYLLDGKQLDEANIILENSSGLIAESEFSIDSFSDQLSQLAFLNTKHDSLSLVKAQFDTLMNLGDNLMTSSQDFIIRNHISEAGLYYIRAYEYYKQASEMGYDDLLGKFRIESIRQELEGCMRLGKECANRELALWLLAEIALLEDENLLAKERIQDILDIYPKYTNKWSTIEFKELYEELFLKNNPYELEGYINIAVFNDQLVLSDNQEWPSSEITRLGWGLMISRRIPWRQFKLGINYTYQNYSIIYDIGDLSTPIDDNYTIDFYSQFLFMVIFAPTTSKYVSYSLLKKLSPELLVGYGPRIFLSSESFEDNVYEAVKWARIFSIGYSIKLRTGKKGNTNWFFNGKYEFSEKYDIGFKDVPGITGKYISRNIAFRTGITYRF